MQVFEEEHGGFVARDPLKKRPDGGEQLIALSRRHLVESEEPRQPGLDPLLFLDVRHELGDDRAQLRTRLHLLIAFGNAGP